MVSATWEYLSCLRVTCSVKEEGRGHGTNKQLLSQNYQLKKDGVKEKVKTLNLFTNYKKCRMCNDLPTVKQATVKPLKIILPLSTKAIQSLTQ